MKRLCLLVFGLFNIAVAQDRTYRHWVYGVYGSPNVDYRLLHAGASEPSLDAERKTERARLSYDLGLSATYYVTERISLQTGLEYTDMGYKDAAERLTWADGTTATAHTSFHYRYLILPLAANYYFLERKNYRVYAGAGVSPAVFTGEATKFSYGSTQNTDSQPVGYDRFNCIADIRLGLDYKLSDRIQVTGGLFFKQFLNATNSNLPTREYLNAAGLQIGVSYYRFKHK